MCTHTKATSFPLAAPCRRLLGCSLPAMIWGSGRAGRGGTRAQVSGREHRERPARSSHPLCKQGSLRSASPRTRGDGPQLSCQQHRLQKEICTSLEKGRISLCHPAAGSPAKQGSAGSSLAHGSGVLAGEGAEPGRRAKHKQARSKKASVSGLAAHFSGLFASYGTARHEYYVLSYQKSREMEGMAD